MFPNKDPVGFVLGAGLLVTGLDAGALVPNIDPEGFEDDETGFFAPPDKSPPEGREELEVLLKGDLELLPMELCETGLDLLTEGFGVLLKELFEPPPIPLLEGPFEGPFIKLPAI